MQRLGPPGPFSAFAVTVMSLNAPGAIGPMFVFSGGTWLRIVSPVVAEHFVVMTGFSGHWPVFVKRYVNVACCPEQIVGGVTPTGVSVALIVFTLTSAVSSATFVSRSEIFPCPLARA